MNYTYQQETNRNGEQLLELIDQCQLTICNCNFKKRRGKLWTYTDPKGGRYQKDYILINNKWRNSVTNTEAYNSFDSVGSDHRIVTAKIRLSLRSPKQQKTTSVNYDWKLLRYDKKLSEHYTIEVKNRYHALTTEEDTLNEQYEKFVISTKEAAKKLIPTKPKERKHLYQAIH